MTERVPTDNDLDRVSNLIMGVIVAAQDPCCGTGAMLTITRSISDHF